MMKDENKVIIENYMSALHQCVICLFSNLL